MADNIQRSRGRGQGYHFDRGGTPAEFGPYIGIVKNNIDPTRSGRLQVFIEQFAGSDPTNPSLWRTVSYCPPFYGITPQSGTNQGVGSYVGNPNTYGMWFTPPDLETQVMCFFAAGDPNQGYYTGCVMTPGVSHMVPGIAAATRYQSDNKKQDPYFAEAIQVPVTEINDENVGISQNPQFYKQSKPVHSFVAGSLIQQGLINDVIRGPITSTSQRESPSAVFGISTPGRAVYQGGLNEADIRAKLESGDVLPEDIRVVGRRGGHSIVMDDGDLQGYDNLIRIRTSKGHQITMSDDGSCFYITHANGQTWLEFGAEGTVDVFATNSVNVRTKGVINLHADKDINMYAAESFNIKSKKIKMEATEEFDISSLTNMKIFASVNLGIRSDGTLAIKSENGGWNAGTKMALKADKIDLNGPAPPIAQKPQPFKDIELDDTKFVYNEGWTVEEGKLVSIVTRAPTHEPYPFHNQGVDVSVDLGDPGAEVSQTESLPPRVTITRIS